MSRKPESTFEARINRHLSKEVYHEKMGTGFNNGTPDRWYEGNDQNPDLWVEYKFLQVIPRTIDLTNTRARVKLSKLQNRWLSRAYRKKRNVAVIVGMTGGYAVILQNKEWEATFTKEEFMNRAVTVKEAAQWISKMVCGSDDQ